MTTRFTIDGLKVSLLGYGAMRLRTVDGGHANGWAAMNSVKTWEQMRRMGITSDLHTLCKRPHCFQKAASPGTGSYTWLGRIWEFMNHKGFNK